MTRPTAKNGQVPIATITTVDSVERGLVGLRKMGLDLQTQPLKEMRLQMGLEVHLVYLTVRVPIGGGVKLRLPVMTTFTPRFYSPTGAQHLSQPARQHRS